MERLLASIVHGIEDSIKSDLDRCGFFYRIFSRAKSKASIKHKISIKGDTYSPTGKKMQDIIGVRVTFYFKDDVQIFANYLQGKELYNEISCDPINADVFKPERLNIIMNMSPKLKDSFFDLINGEEHAELMDGTYEIQIRTVLSEGWHEVEHDLRYKCKADWDGLIEESRILNGIFATLQTSEWTMFNLFEQIAHTNYKNRSWTTMLKNKMRLRFINVKLQQNVLDYLNYNRAFAKELFRYPREEFLTRILFMGVKVPITMDFIVFFFNRLVVNDENVIALEGNMTNSILNNFFNEN